MQELFKKTCGPILRDLLDIRQLTIAYHRPTNLRDLLMPSKLKQCDKEDYKVSFHTKGTHLEHSINSLDYTKLRESDIPNEKDNLSLEIKRLNKFTKKATNKIITYNPYSKKHFWQRINNQNHT